MCTCSFSLVDKELAGCLHSESCGQWLHVQVETSDKWDSSGLGTGTGDVWHLCQGHGQWDWHTLSKFRKTPQWLMPWRKRCHPEGPWQAGEMNFMKFNKAECKILQVRQGNPKHKYWFCTFLKYKYHKYMCLCAYIYIYTYVVFYSTVDGMLHKNMWN